MPTPIQIPSSPLTEAYSSADDPDSPASLLKRKAPKLAIPMDQKQISAAAWTPITIGVPISKRRRKSTPDERPPEILDGTNGKLVRLFDPGAGPSDSAPHLIPQVDDPPLVSVEQKVSIYVSCFEEMLKTVLEHEHYLFSRAELNVLGSWDGLPYSSRYLFVRLFMRKHSSWFRLDKLSNYKTDIDDIEQACKGLCRSIDDLLDSLPAEPVIRSQQRDHDHQFHAGPSNKPAPQTRHFEYLPHHPVDPAALPTLPNLPRPTSPGVIPELLERWCLAVGQVSHALDCALATHGIHEWKSPYLTLDDLSAPDAPRATLPPIPSPVYTPRTATIPPDDLPQPLSPIPAAVPMRPKATTPPPCSPFFAPESPPALDESDADLEAFAMMTTDHTSLLSTDDLFSCMSLDELKALAKQMKTNRHTTRDMIIFGLKAATKNQSTLTGGGQAKGKEKRQLSLKYNQKGLKEHQSMDLNKKILKVIGPCIKLSPAVSHLFKRLHLIFYRSRIVSEKTMTASTLARMNIRSYPTYQVQRSQYIFESRQALLKYERALELERRFDELISNPEEPKQKLPSNVEEKARRQEARDLRLKQALQVFELAWLEWQEAVMEENARRAQMRQPLGISGSKDEIMAAEYDRSGYYRMRFHPGWPLTRIVYKGSSILSRFKEYQREVDVLEALLHQLHFRRGKRGEWYDRLALVLMNHFSDAQLNPEQKRENRELALYTCQAGLKDADTHEIYRASLTRRYNRLRSLLGHPPDEQDENTIDDGKSHQRVSIRRVKLSDGHETGKKSVWQGVVDGSELSVEEVCLEHYVTEGWRGFHSEGGILKMLFSLIFWDVIFAPVEGAFETPFQTAPLDLATDAFVIARAPLIVERLERIESRGIIEALERMSETYAREAARQTWCVGVQWDRYGIEELSEIVECLGVQAICIICKVFMEDWGHRSGGIPDLCLWKIGEKKCRFVEVKGPGDRLSEQQISWIHILSNTAGVEVEVCAVKEV